MNRIIAKLIFVVFFIGMLGSCSSTDKIKSHSETESQENSSPNSKMEKKTMLTFKRTSCYGKCPVYDFTVFTDKTCELNGKLFFVAQGINHGTLTQVQYDDILKTISTIGFFALDDVYDDPYVQDIPATYITVNIDSKSKSIKSRYRSPAALRDFLTELHELAKTMAWKK